MGTQNLMDFRIVLDQLMKMLIHSGFLGQLLSGIQLCWWPLQLAGACGPKRPVAGNASAHPAAFWKTFWLLSFTFPAS